MPFEILNQTKQKQMADNPTKKGADAKRVSQQPHEQAYQKRKAAGKTGAASKSSSSKGAAKKTASKGAAKKSASKS